MIIPDSVTTIYDMAFEGCEGFTKLKLNPYTVSEIKNLAFRNCKGLTGVVTVPKKYEGAVEGMLMFDGCENIEIEYK